MFLIYKFFCFIFENNNTVINNLTRVINLNSTFSLIISLLTQTVSMTMSQQPSMLYVNYNNQIIRNDTYYSSIPLLLHNLKHINTLYE